MQLDKRGKVQEGSYLYCSYPCSNLLAVPVFLYIFTYRMGFVISHAALCNKVPAFRI